MSALRDIALEGELLALAAGRPELVEYAHSLIELAARAKPTRQEKLDERDAVIREGFYSDISKPSPNAAATSLADKLVNFKTLRDPVDNEENRLLRRILELNDGKVLSRWQILNILYGTRT